MAPKWDRKEETGCRQKGHGGGVQDLEVGVGGIKGLGWGMRGRGKGGKYIF